MGSPRAVSAAPGARRLAPAAPPGPPSLTRAAEILLSILLRPGHVLLRLWRAFPIGPFPLRLKYDILPRPHYAYCLYQAACLAQRLGIPRVSALEFGVAGGNGLLELQDLATHVESTLGVGVDVYGFDTGHGLPPPLDYRDLPYLWREGFFKMDAPALQTRLTTARLVLGDVRETVPRFLQRPPAPIGAVLFDLDYYSSTRDALAVLRAPCSSLLPRVYCYFDDIVSSETAALCEAVGQLRAIREYNELDPNRHLAPLVGLRHRRPVPAVWNEQIYVHHAFDHPEYCTYVHPDAYRDLPLARARTASWRRRNSAGLAQHGGGEA